MNSSHPSVTVGIVVLDREWVIGSALHAVLAQTYPHDRIFVLVVDGESKDKTAETAKKILEKSDFNGYDIIVKKSSIPEGRNICIEKMRGDLLLFWDSDVIMEPNAIQELFSTMKQQKVDIVTTNVNFIFINSVRDVEAKVEQAMKSQATENCIQETISAGMGYTLISRNALESVRFDPDLTICEDFDFSVRAREKGFRIVVNKKIRVLDVNMIKKDYSDIHVDMPLKNAMKGMRKKARAQVLGYGFPLTFSGMVRFFSMNKRYMFYLGYIPTAIFTIIGILLNSLFLIVVFPFYLLFFAFWQVKRRGFKRGAKAISKSFLVGVPTSLWIVYYFSKYTLRKKLCAFG